MYDHLGPLLKELRKQARYPTSSDTYLRLFFKALISISRNNSEILQMIYDIQKERTKTKHYLINVHAVYLLTHIINYIMIFLEKRPNYPYEADLFLNTQTGWEQLISYLFCKYKSEIKKFLFEKDLQQNIPERGITIPFFVNTILLGKKRLRVVDFGCSANFVWASLITQKLFPQIFDETQNTLISQHKDRVVDVKEFIGIDYRFPLATDEGKKWLLACRHPKEVRQEYIHDTQELLYSFKLLQQVKIVEQPFLQSKLSSNHYDIITFNNSLYQTPQNMQLPTLIHAEKFLDQSDGLMIIQDNCKVKKINGDNALVLTDDRKDYTYRVCIGGPIVKRLFSKPWLEVFRFKNTRCTAVKAGSDYKEYLRKLSLV